MCRVYAHVCEKPTYTHSNISSCVYKLLYVYERAESLKCVLCRKGDDINSCMCVCDG